MIRRAAPLLVLGALVLSAAGPDRPLLLPLRDVDVTYDVPGPKDVLHQRMRWDVADRLLRVDPPGPGLYMIVNYGDSRMSVVRDADHTVLQLPTSQMMLPGADAAGGGFTRLGDGTFAGLGCAGWRTTDTAGREAVICVTADGVMLQASSGGQILLQASRVAYAAQPADVFRAPSGYRVLTPPTGR